MMGISKFNIWGKEAEDNNNGEDYYNTIVSEYNELFGNFYARVIAKSYGFQTREMFEIS